MEDYFKRAKIDNPLNIKRVSGDLPTTKSSSKNVFILLIAFAAIGLTINKVWEFLLFYVKSPVFTGIIIGLVYGLTILKIFSVTIFEEKKQKKAYKDLLDNKMSNLSVIWEIQDIKEGEVNGTKMTYIDYINGTRTLLLKCVPGSVLNLSEDTPKYHYSAIEKTLKYLDDLGYNWDIHVVEEPVTDDKALAFYYDNLKNYDDESFIDIFTEQLDTIAYVSELRSAIHVTYIEISGAGKYKHNMLNNLYSLPEIMGTNNIFKSVEIMSSKAEVDHWIAYQNSVSMFDREELIMNKYRNSYNLNMTSVLGAFDEEGNMIKQFNKDFDPKRIVRKKSIDIQSSKDNIKNPAIKSKEIPLSEEPKETDIQNKLDEVVNIGELADTKHKKFIELLYSKDKVKLG